MSVPAVNPAGAPGWFGKLPALGDFASRRLPEGFVRRWDRWLQRGLALARAQQGTAWLDGYLVAPIHRFWIAPRVLGHTGWAGLLMPSVDRVGRHFPFTLAQPVDALPAALAARDGFRALEAVARQVLDVAFTLDDLERALARLAPIDADAADDAARRLSQRLLRDFPSGTATVWWCNDAGEAAQFACFPAMPPAPALVSMMGGPS